MDTPFPDSAIDPLLVLKAYSIGLFPMAQSRDDPTLVWVEPHERGIIPLSAFHISRSLAKKLRQGIFSVSFNVCFPQVIALCAAQRPARPDTWINQPIEAVFNQLAQLGYAHSVEIWQDDRLVGGLYGLALGSAFFGESMVSLVPNASKAALVYTAAALEKGGFTLFDTQFYTPHLGNFGARAIDRQTYQALLTAALARPARFPNSVDINAYLQSRTQTS